MTPPTLCRLNRRGRHALRHDGRGRLIFGRQAVRLIRSYEGCGTVFSVTPGGTEKVLHSFGEAGDGANPLWADLIDVSGTLYGTTNAGGSYACYGS